MSRFLWPRTFALGAALCLAATVALLILREPIAGVVGCFGVILAILAHDLADRERWARATELERGRRETRETAHRAMAALMVLPPYDQGETWDEAAS